MQQLDRAKFFLSLIFFFLARRSMDNAMAKSIQWRPKFSGVCCMATVSIMLVVQNTYQKCVTNSTFLRPQAGEIIRKFMRNNLLQTNIELKSC